MVRLIKISVIFLSSAIVLTLLILVVIIFPLIRVYFILFDFYPFIVAFTTDVYTILFLFLLLMVSIRIMFFASFYIRGDLKNSWFLVVLLMFISRIILLSLASRLFVIFIA